MCGSCGKQPERARNQLSQCCQPQPVESVNPCNTDYERQQRPLVERNPCIGDYERHMYELQEEDICDKGPREPYHIPGYAGHVPTLQSRSGGTYGHDTHKVLASSTNETSLSNRHNGHLCPTPLHQPYHIPGYTGHVPGLQYMVGGTYGQDTHKLLYPAQAYPNRQENISPYREDQQTILQQDNNMRNARTADPPHKKWHYTHKPLIKSEAVHSMTSAPLEPYQKPIEYYQKPQYKYRIGDTYATTADITLVDPCVNQEHQVVVSTRELDDTQVVRTQNNLEERVQEFPYINQPIRHRPMVPGFDAYIDRLRGARGQCFEFSDVSPSHKQLQQQLILPKGNVREPLRTGDSGLGNHQQQQPHYQPVENDIPYGYARYGDKPQKYTNSLLYDFTSNYRTRQSSEWALANISRPDPPAFDPPGQIYSEHTGLLPGYSAHIPGAQFRCGKTFTDDTRDAKRALRGDRF